MLLFAQLLRHQVWVAFAASVITAITEHALTPALESAQLDAYLAAALTKPAPAV